MKEKLKKKPGRRILLLIEVLLGTAAAVSVLWAYLYNQPKPRDLLVQYFQAASDRDYEQMYSLLCEESQELYTYQEFLERNQNIYEGIEAGNFQTDVTQVKSSGTGKRVYYTLEMDSDAGKIQMENSAFFQKEGLGKYALYWEHSLIFPGLLEDDRVQISKISSTRGSILDRNGTVLAGQGIADSVGLVPGKMSTGSQREADLKRLAELLDMDVQTIQTKLEASWVKADSFVPLKLLDHLQPLGQDMKEAREGEDTRQTLQLELLAIAGVLITEQESRLYPYREAAAHLVGYVQNVTGEDLQEHQGEGYSQDSQIGKAGAELLYEETLRGIDGCKIAVLDRNGREKQVVAARERRDGRDVKLTIDIQVQKALYEVFQKDRSASGAINPKTGEILALVSTPAYDPHDFLRGMSQKQWDSYNNDKNRPLENRFRAVWCPGSSFKPLVAGIGLTGGWLDPNEDFGNVGLSWQKDETWGDYQVTTLQAYEPVVLSNALLYSDNIYFAKAALRIGAQNLETALTGLGFGERVPCDIWMTESQFSNGDHIGSEILLADTGYGQGEVLVNPLHMAVMYSAFVNQGNLIRTRLRMDEAEGELYWKKQVFSESAVELINQALIQVIENPGGTGYPGYLEGLTLAGKTGTAEIKATQEDQDGTELGWYAVYTPYGEGQDSICIVSMVEDVKERSGSTYVVNGVKEVLKTWAGNQGV